MRRYLVNPDVSTAHCPDWYALIQAAKYLNVAPWDLLEQPVFWKDKALIAMTAEHEAAEIQQEHLRAKQHQLVA